MDQTNIKIFHREFSGEIILPDNAAYEKARATFIHKGSPALVVRPNSSDDVAVAIRFAQNNSLLLSIRSGGHNGAGLGTNNGGLVIDLSAMNNIRLIDREKHIVRIESGAIWKNVALALQEHGLALSSGDSTTVGVGGLALGGGIGWMVRKYGLTIDSLVAAEVVTADGRVLRASAIEHADLFWAIRGGGGNFGVVTNFEFAAHPVNKVYSGMIIYALENVPALLKGWRDYMRVATEDLTVMFLLMPSFMGNPPSAIAWCCYAGDDEASAMKAIDPLLQIGNVVQNLVTKKNYADVLEDPHPPEGMKIIVNNGFTEKFSDEFIHTVAKHYGKDNSPVLQIRSVGGAMNRVTPNATAFAHRNSEALFISATFLPLNASDSDTEKAMIPWNSIFPFTFGAYVNFFSEATEKEVSIVYPKTTYERLAMIKKVYDPKNIFNQNYNIPPAR
ncbi:MAG: FAD-binding oxidoreductase [Bacteroidota bacterium]